jgi:hypothetical protein
LVQLDAQIDRRVVRTFFATIEVLLPFRHRAHGLLLWVDSILEQPESRVAEGMALMFLTCAPVLAAR